MIDGSSKSARKNLIADLGTELFLAWKNNSPIQPISERIENLSISEAYDIQLHFLERRTSGGEAVIGKKIGATSNVVQAYLGVYQPDFGHLTSGMDCSAQSVVGVDQLIQPKAEGELAFVLKKTIRGPGVTDEDVLDATDYILPSIEVVDSRIKDWKIRITDTVADNASCGVFAVGKDRGNPKLIDLPSLKMTMLKNGNEIAHGTGKDVMGSPVSAVAWLANTLGEYGIPLLAGEIILSGSQSPLIPIEKGDVITCVVEKIGSCTIRFS